MKNKHWLKTEEKKTRAGSARDALLRSENTFANAHASEDDAMMTFRQKNDEDAKENKIVNTAGCIAKCICISVLAVSFVLCMAEGYGFAPDVFSLIALTVFSCASFSLIALGNKLRIFGAVLLLPTAFILLRFCGLMHLHPIDAARFFYEYVCGLLYEKGYTFLPDPTVSSVWISEEGQFTVFSTEICAFIALIFSAVCVYSIMGKKIRSIYLGAFVGAYIIFSFFIGFYPTNNTFALLICSLASVFFMVTYEKSLKGFHLRTNIKDDSIIGMSEASLSLKRIVCFALLSSAYVFIFLDSMELIPTVLNVVSYAVISLICILIYFTSFKLKETNKTVVWSALIILIAVILITTVFVIGILDDVAGDINYIVSHVYHKLSEGNFIIDDTLPGGVFTLSQIETLRASENFYKISLRMMTFWQLLIIPFSAFLFLGAKFRYILMGVFSLVITFVTFFFGFHFSFISIILISAAVLTSYILLFSDALKRSSLKKEAAIKRSPEKLSEKKVKNERARLSLPSHAKQGFIGIVTLAMSALMVFTLAAPASLGAFPKIDILDGQMRTVRALIQAYMGNSGNITSEIIGGDIGGGNVSDDPIEFNDTLKIIADTSRRESFYLRGWIGKEYDNGKWNDADPLDMIRFKQRFGEGFMPDVLYTSYAEFLSRTSNTLNNIGFDYILSTIAYTEPGAHLLLVPSYSVPNRISYEMGYELHFLGDSVYYMTQGSDLSREAFAHRGEQTIKYRSSAYVPDYSSDDFISATEENIRLYEYFKELLKSLGPEKTLYSLRSTVPQHDKRILEIADDSDIEYLLDVFYETALIEDEYEKYVYEEYLGLTEKIASSERMKRLYEEVTRESGSDLESAFLLAEYFSNNYIYTTSPVPGDNGGGDYIESFIFDTKRGYCTHFATAMVNLLRLGGIPARYAEGYYADANEAIPAKYGADTVYQYSVLDKNAHAWVEAYIEGIGWMIFEPTAGYGNSPWGGGDPSSDAPPTEIPGSGNNDTDIPDDDTDNDEPEPLPPTEQKYEISSGVWYALVITAVFLIVASVAMRPVLTRKRRARSFLMQGKQGGTAMMKYLIKVFGYVGVSVKDYEGMVCFSDNAFSKLEKYTDGSIMTFDKKGLVEVLSRLQENEFSPVELTTQEKQTISDYIFRITDSIYRNSGIIGKIYGRYIMNVI